MSLSAVVSNLQLDWIGDVSSDDFLEKALPLGDHKFTSPGSKGSWRAHMNALQASVLTQYRGAKSHHSSHYWR